MVRICRLVPIICLAFVMTAASAGGVETPGAGSPAPKDGATTIAPGDLVTLSLTLTLTDGSLVFTTDAIAANDNKTPKAAYYRTPVCFQPMTVAAGAKTIVPGLQDSLPGMRDGETREFMLPPAKGFGEKNDKSHQTFTRIKMEKRVETLSEEEYADRFGAAPKLGDIVELNPYFLSKVTAVNPSRVEIENMAEDGARIEGPFGFTTIRVVGDYIKIMLDPAIGSTIEVNGRKGVILSSGSESFTVDFDHPLAGNPLRLKITVLRVIQKAKAGSRAIKWVEDHDMAIGLARKEGKPAVMVLYAPWCPFSRKYLEETLDDPRIRDLADRFVWARVESDRNSALMSRYGQKSHPLTLVLDPGGKELYRINGAAEAARLRAVLDCVIAGMAVNEQAETQEAAEPQAGHCDSNGDGEVGR